MKTLSLWQLWASAMFTPLKRNETRGRYTSYRGPVAIQAAKTTRKLEMGFDLRTEWNMMTLRERQEFAGIGIVLFEQIPLGCVLGVGNLVDCVRVERAGVKKDSDEFAWGNYAPGRFAWIFEDMHLLPAPCPAIGKQMLLFEWEPPTAELSVWFAEKCLPMRRVPALAGALGREAAS